MPTSGLPPSFLPYWFGSGFKPPCPYVPERPEMADDLRTATEDADDIRGVASAEDDGLRLNTDKCR